MFRLCAAHSPDAGGRLSGGVKNNFHESFEKMIDKIRLKGGLIYPCLWFAWTSSHKNTKIIELN